MEFSTGGRIAELPASRLARQWHSHAEAMHIALSRRPDDTRVAYLKINMKILSYLLKRYRDDPDLDRDAVSGDVGENPGSRGPAIEICDTLRPVRTSAEIGVVLDRISRAAEGLQDFGDDEEPADGGDPKRRAGFFRSAVLLVILSWVLLCWYVTSPDLRGTGAPAASSNLPPSSEDERAMRMYHTAYGLLVEQRDQVAAARIFRQCLDRYSHTRYMNETVAPHNMTRIQVIERLIEAIEQ